MSDEWPEPPREPGPFAGGPAVGPPAGPTPADDHEATTATGAPADAAGSPWASPSIPSPSTTPGGSPWPGAASPSGPAFGSSSTPPPPPPPAGPGAGPAPWATPGSPPAGAIPFSPPGTSPGTPPGTPPGAPYGQPAGPGGGPAFGGPDFGGPAFGAGPGPAQPGVFAHPGQPGNPGPPVQPPSAWGGAPAAWQPPGGPGGSAPTRPADRAPAWLLGLAALVIVLLVGGAAYVVTSESGPDYPDEWDARVAPLAAFAAKERGLEFEHPVVVNFLTPEEYSAAARGDGDGGTGPTEEEKKEMEEFVAMLRALGLVEGTFDLEAASNQLADAGTLAFYDPAEKQVYVRGTELTPSLRVTLVHELTHVLQDQHFDLEQVGNAEGPVTTTLRAMAEGDAGRVEDVYIQEGLSDAERKEHEQQQSEDAAEVETDLADVPPFLSASFGAPYAFGPAVVEIAFATEGNAGVDALFEDPPSEFALFDPIGFPPDEHTAADQELIEIPLPEGTEKIDADTFGPVNWYLLLASRLGEEAAFDAIEGVASDGFLSYRQDGKVCVKGAARADEAQADELRTALEQWAAKGPDGTAEVGGSGGQVDLTSCDPGADAVSDGEVTEDLLILPVRRNYTFAQVIESGKAEGADREQAECYALGIFDLLTTAEIVDPAWMPSDAQKDEIAEIAAGCR